jgi:uncharacterized protein
MMSPLDTTKLAEICRRNDVSRLGVFGSAARGEATALSDLDLLVNFSRRKGILAVVSLERQLADALGRKVDLVKRPSALTSDPESCAISG